MSDRYEYLYDHAEVLEGPDGVAIHVPPLPPRHDDDITSDQPNGVPPMIVSARHRDNYWKLFNDGVADEIVERLALRPEQLVWLKSQEERVSQAQTRRLRR